MSGGVELCRADAPVTRLGSDVRGARCDGWPMVGLSETAARQGGGGRGNGEAGDATLRFTDRF